MEDRDSASGWNAVFVTIGKFVSNLPEPRYTVSKGLPLRELVFRKGSARRFFVNSMVMETIWGVLIPFFGTSLGALCVLLLKGRLNRRLQRGMAGFAAGVMVAASVWSLLIPAIEQSEGMGKLAFVPATVGFSIGFFFLLALDYIIPQPPEPLDCDSRDSRLRKLNMMVLAVTLHNIPEGMAVGVMFAALLTGDDLVTASAAMALSVGIAVQNFPEGAIVSMPLRGAGVGKGKSLLLGILSGAVEPLVAAIMLVTAVWIAPAMPYFLSFASGAMFYVVVEELIPEMQDGVRNKVGAVSFSGGFLIMMILDVALG